MRAFLRTALLCGIAVLTGGCAELSGDQRATQPESLASHSQGIATEASECLERVGASDGAGFPELDSARIRLVSWNVEKGSDAGWRDDLNDLASDKDLILMQEAALEPDPRALADMPHWSFAPGYRNRSDLTGVVTYSTQEPIVQCNLTSMEPWLGTPKATGITEYGLTGTDETLVVVNIHVVNFEFGVRDFQSQLEQIRPILAEHRGPIILSGDFNTWRKRRGEILDLFVGDLDLQPVVFAEDHRSRFLGQRLDHIYVRGLKVGMTGTRKVNTSDHNPLFAEFWL
jgi:endonuclease/exonuclease/phosphatase (EEP) superfamily protein YafD